MKTNKSPFLPLGIEVWTVLSHCLCSLLVLTCAHLARVACAHLCFHIELQLTCAFTWSCSCSLVRTLHAHLLGKNKTPGALTADADLEAKYMFDESLGDPMLGRHVAAGSGEGGSRDRVKMKATHVCTCLHACINHKSIYASSISCACSLARPLCLSRFSLTRARCLQ